MCVCVCLCVFVCVYLSINISTSPMAELAGKYANKQVLLLGKDTCRDAAEAYGLKRTVLADEVLAWRKDIWSFRQLHPHVKLPPHVCVFVCVCVFL
jgi:ribonucleotide monophosphatase NagD (HAD superfamily)